MSDRRLNSAIAKAERLHGDERGREFNSELLLDVLLSLKAGAYPSRCLEDAVYKLRNEPLLPPEATE